MLFDSDEESDILLHEDAARQQHTTVLFSDDEDDEDNVRRASPTPPRTTEPPRTTRSESSESIPEAIEVNGGEEEEEEAVPSLSPVQRAPSPGERISNIDTHAAARATSPPAAKHVKTSAPKASAAEVSGSPAQRKGHDSPRPIVVPRPHPLVAERDAGDKAKKREAMRSIQQHELKLSALHHEVWSVVAKEAGKDYALLEELRLSLDTALASETSRLASVIQRISRNVRSLQASLQAMQETPTVQWMEALQNSMEAIEHGITALKEQQREQYDVLMKGEKGLTSELDQFAQRVEAWDHLDSAAKNMLFAPSTALAANVPPEVAVYERFVVEHGGLNGGWDEYDHGTFMRLRARAGQQPDFIARVLSALPTKEEPDVRRHEEWFAKLLQLQESKRIAIAQWKDRKRAQDEAERARLEQDKAQQEAQEKQEQERERLRKIAEKEEKKASLLSWKQQQEQERQAAERQRQESEQRQREAAARAEEEKRTHIQEKLKVVQQVRAREQQEREQQARALALAEAERRRAAQSELHVFQERDQAALAEKARKEKAALAEEAAREERLQRLRSTVKVNVARDPARLLRATESTKHRAADESRPGGRVYIAGPALAVPTWRKGL